MLSGRRFEGVFARAGRVMEDIGDIIAPCLMFVALNFQIFRCKNIGKIKVLAKYATVHLYSKQLVREAVYASRCA